MKSRDECEAETAEAEAEAECERAGNEGLGTGSL